MTRSQRGGSDSEGTVRTDEIITPEVLAAIDEVIGGKGALPEVRQMAETIAAALDSKSPINLYWRVYVPISTFFVHANGTSLLRHVSPSNALLNEPEYPWALRCTLRTADGCMGLLALAITHKRELPTRTLERYAGVHLDRALAPLAIVSGKSMLRSLGLKDCITLVKGLAELRSYYLSGEAEADEWEVRSEKERAWFVKYMGGYDATPETVLAVYIERFVIAIAGEPPISEPTSDASV